VVYLAGRHSDAFQCRSKAVFGVDVCVGGGGVREGSTNTRHQHTTHQDSERNTHTHTCFEMGGLQKACW